MSLPFCPSRGRGHLPRSAARNSPLNLNEKPAARQERIADATRVPRSPGAERRCRPDRVNRLCGSSAPVIRCQMISPEKASVFKMHPPCGALRCPLIVCDEHQRMPRPMQSVKQLQHAVCCGRIQSCGRLIRQNHARFCHDRPCGNYFLCPGTECRLHCCKY